MAAQPLHAQAEQCYDGGIALCLPVLAEKKGEFQDGLMLHVWALLDRFAQANEPFRVAGAESIDPCEEQGLIHWLEHCRV